MFGSWGPFVGNRMLISSGQFRHFTELHRIIVPHSVDYDINYSGKINPLILDKDYFFFNLDEDKDN